MGSFQDGYSLDSGGFLAGSAFRLSPVFPLKVNFVLNVFGHVKTKDGAISALSVCRQEESTFRYHQTMVSAQEARTLDLWYPLPQSRVQCAIAPH